MRTTPTTARLITVREAADLLALKQSTIRLWLYRGVLPKVKLGSKSVRIPLADVIRLIEESTVRTPCGTGRTGQ